MQNINPRGWNLNVFGDNVLVRLVSQIPQPSDHIIVPVTTQVGRERHEDHGIVVAVGKDCALKDILREGDRVLIMGQGVFPVKVENVAYAIVPTTAIRGRLVHETGDHEFGKRTELASQ